VNFYFQRWRSCCDGLRGDGVLARSGVGTISSRAGHRNRLAGNHRGHRERSDTTRILYVTAHPDDESAAVLTYLARGLHADVALLSLTRGEGGQNDLGPEQAPQLGLIRTEELLAGGHGATA